MVKTSNTLIVNEQIKHDTITLIDSSGTNLGLKTLKESLKIAKDARLDLVQVKVVRDVAICKIMDVKLFLYKGRSQAKKSTPVSTTKVKEVKCSLSIGENDLNTKLNKVRHFLSKGFKVKLQVTMHGRQRIYKEKGEKMLETMCTTISDIGKVIGSKQGFNFTYAIISPKK